MRQTSDLARLGGGARARVSYFPTAPETGSVFSCAWVQVLHYLHLLHSSALLFKAAPGGRMLYSGRVESAPLEVRHLTRKFPICFEVNE